MQIRMLIISLVLRVRTVLAALIVRFLLAAHTVLLWHLFSTGVALSLLSDIGIPSFML